MIATIGAAAGKQGAAATLGYGCDVGNSHRHAPLADKRTRRQHARRSSVMAKGVEKKAQTNKPKLSIKEKQAKKKEKAAGKGK